MNHLDFNRVNIIEVIKNLPIESIVNLCKVDKNTAYICNNREMWRYLLQRDYDQVSRTTDPKSEYKQIYRNIHNKDLMEKDEEMRRSIKERLVTKLDELITYNPYVDIKDGNITYNYRHFDTFHNGTTHINPSINNFDLIRLTDKRITIVFGASNEEMYRKVWKSEAYKWWYEIAQRAHPNISIESYYGREILIDVDLPRIVDLYMYNLDEVYDL